MRTQSIVSLEQKRIINPLKTIQHFFHAIFEEFIKFIVSKQNDIFEKKDTAQIQLIYTVSRVYRQNFKNKVLRSEKKPIFAQVSLEPQVL